MSGLAPPSTTITSDMAPGGFCDTSQRRSSSGSATVADRPIILQFRHEAAQARQAKRQQMAALRRDQRMQFVEHDEAQIGEEAFGIASTRSAAPAARAW